VEFELLAQHGGGGAPTISANGEYFAANPLLDDLQHR
jgi:hypothetical protein